MQQRTKPTKADLQQAVHKTLADVIAPGLDVLFCGINPGLYTAAIGHHFGRPGNRFWPALFLGGFTPVQYSPYQDQELLKLGYGITNIVERTTARAEELTKDELTAGGARLRKKILKYKPKFVAILGLGAYRVAFNNPKATIGEQEAVGSTRVWVLPSPSGLNAHVTVSDLGKLFAELKHALDLS